MFNSILILIFLFFVAHDGLGQKSSGGGIFEQYADLRITKVIEFHYSYSGFVPCDSTPLKIQSFNSKGQMIKESFRGSGKTYPYYLFDYNDEGFLVNIDTLGIFGYGHGSSLYKDTTYEQIRINETWISFDTTRRLVETTYSRNNDSTIIKKSIDYNNSGKILTEHFYTKDGTFNFVLTNSIHYLYNPIGLIEKIVWKDENNNAYEITEYHYEMSN